MPTKTDLNERIAKVKGWTQDDTLLWVMSDPPHPTEWRDPYGIPEMLFDWVGTLEGVAELLQELYATCHCVAFEPFGCDKWRCSGTREEVNEAYEYESDRTRPGDCIAMAWLGIFGGA